MVDIRIPIGLMFSVLGVLITVFGFVNNVRQRTVSTFPGYQRKHYNGCGDADFWACYALSFP